MSPLSFSKILWSWQFLSAKTKLKLGAKIHQSINTNLCTNSRLLVLIEQTHLPTRLFLWYILSHICLFCELSSFKTRIYKYFQLRLNVWTFFYVPSSFNDAKIHSGLKGLHFFGTFSCINITKSTGVVTTRVSQSHLFEIITAPLISTPLSLFQSD